MGYLVILRHTKQTAFNGQGKTSPGRSMHAVLSGTSAIQTENREFSVPPGIFPHREYTNYDRFLVNQI
jgi:hypothetical protein